MTPAERARLKFQKQAGLMQFLPEAFNHIGHLVAAKAPLMGVVSDHVSPLVGKAFSGLSSVTADDAASAIKHVVKPGMDIIKERNKFRRLGQVVSDSWTGKGLHGPKSFPTGDVTKAPDDVGGGEVIKFLASAGDMAMSPSIAKAAIKAAPQVMLNDIKNTPQAVRSGIQSIGTGVSNAARTMVGAVAPPLPAIKPLMTLPPKRKGWQGAHGNSAAYNQGFMSKFSSVDENLQHLVRQMLLTHDI